MAAKDIVFTCTTNSSGTYLAASELPHFTAWYCSGWAKIYPASVRLETTALRRMCSAVCASGGKLTAGNLGLHMDMGISITLINAM